MASRGEPLLTEGIDGTFAYASGKFLSLMNNTNEGFLDVKRSHAILQAQIGTLIFSTEDAEARTRSRLYVNPYFEKAMSSVRQLKEIKARDRPHLRFITLVSCVVCDRERQDHRAFDAFWGDCVDQLACVNFNPWDNTYHNEISATNESCSGQVQTGSVSEIETGQSYLTLREKHLELQRQGLTPYRGRVSV